MLMKVLFFLNPNGLMDRDLIYTLRKRGIEVLEEKINFALTPEGHSVEMFSSSRLMSILDTFRPDMVLCFNGNGVDDQGIISAEYERRCIPYVTWLVDRPRAADLKQKYSKKNTHMFLFDRVYIQMLTDAGFEHVHFLPLATNPDRFRPMENITREDCVCFIGDTDYKKIEYLTKNIDAMVSGADDNFYQAIEKAVQDQYVQVGRDTWHIIDEAMEAKGFSTGRFPLMFRDILEAFVEREASMRLRVDAVKAVHAKYPTVVFGDTLWENVVNSGFKGRISYYTNEIVEVYNRYTVHVNVSKFQLRYAINQRPYDVPACGGFLLTDRRHDLSEVFLPDEMASFGSIEELLDQIEMFIHDKELRKRFALSARERVLSAHTYSHRIDTILDKVGF